MELMMSMLVNTFSLGAWGTSTAAVSLCLAEGREGSKILWETMGNYLKLLNSRCSPAPRIFFYGVAWFAGTKYVP